MMVPHIHILGASGSGTTTLGRALAARLAIAYFDTDDFYWLKTVPPFQTARERSARFGRLSAALDGAARGWTLSGSLASWGNLFMPRFDLVVFLTLPAEIRLARLKAREMARYDAAVIAPGGPDHQRHEAFLEWAARYDTGGLEVRSRVMHEAWLAQLSCPVLRLDSRESVAALEAAVLRGPLSESRAG